MMRLPRGSLPSAIAFVLLGVFPAAAQTRPGCDARAAALLNQSVAVMGGKVPADVSASGQITITAGSTTESGTFRMISRGADQTREQISTNAGTHSLTYSHGRAQLGGQLKSLPQVSAVQSKSYTFPLLVLQSALADRDTACEYVGEEETNGTKTIHVRVWTTFAASPRLQPLAGVSTKDIWFDAASGLPVRLTYEQRRSRGPGSVGLPVAVTYSDYRNVSGILFPFRIRTSLNGSPWLSVVITEVSFNTGLTEADFAIR